MSRRRGRGPADRFLAWLVTGPPGRGLAFAADFVAALRTMLARREGCPRGDSSRVRRR